MFTALVVVMIYMSKFNKMYTLNMCNFWYIDYTSMKLEKKVAGPRIRGFDSIGVGWSPRQLAFLTSCQVMSMHLI